VAVRRGALLIGLACLALAGVPGQALAKPERFTLPGSHLAQIKLDGSHGYRLTLEVSGTGRASARALLSLAASRGHESGQYTTRQRVHFAPDDSIRARLPGVGRIDLSFQPTDTERRPVPRFCSGRAATEATGVFRGHLDLRGRQGFTEVHLRSATGTVHRDYRESCVVPHHPHSDSVTVPGEGESELPLDISAATKQGKRSVGFLATELGARGEGLGLIVLAFAATSQHGVAFTAVDFFRVGAKALEIPDRDSLSQATVAPAAPFSGSAAFDLLAPHRSSWTGDLAATLPGFGRVALAGPRFKSSLCEEERCVGSLPRPKDSFVVSDSSGYAPVSNRPAASGAAKKSGSSARVRPMVAVGRPAAP
jgi:hypothetical protein